MRTHFLFIVFAFHFLNLQASQEITSAEIEIYQNELSEKFSNPETSILYAEDLAVFEGLEFYPIDLSYVVEAVFVRTPNEKPFKMPTTTARRPEYVKYGEAHFALKGKNHVLEIYQPLDRTPEYEDYLFLPFTDGTSGEGSYGGGRYMDLKIPGGETIVLDFNKTYNPYCAYNENYSCPLTPRQNHLRIPIYAGVKDFTSKRKP
jgi:uncharacterized protein (DUF1684 family)